jgi:hypothetical protein
LSWYNISNNTIASDSLKYRLLIEKKFHTGAFRS